MDTVAAAVPASDRIAIADGVEVRFVSRAEWEEAAYVLVEVDEHLSKERLDAYARALAETGLSNLRQTLIFDRTVRVRLLPGEVEMSRRLSESQARVAELEAALGEAKRRAEGFRKLLATRPAAKGAS